MSTQIQKTRKELFIERKRKAWELRQRMWTQERIGLELGITQQAVAKLLSIASEEYLKRHVASVDKIKAQQITQLERISDEAMQAWERSKQDIKSKTLKQDVPLSPELVEYANKSLKKSGGNITQVVYEQNGDPRYLTVAMKAKEDIRKITGADAPTKIINEDSPKNSMYAEIFSKNITMEDAQKAYQDMLNLGNEWQLSTTK